MAGERERGVLPVRTLVEREVCVCVCVCVSIQAFHESLNGALSRMRERAKFFKRSPPFIVKSWLYFLYLIFIFGFI